jgi:ferredoxin
VSCVNKEKGAVAKKACAAACIGCGKCEKECKFEAITIENNLSYIDWRKCKMCKKCVAVCPTGAITAVNFPVSKAKTESAVLSDTKKDAPKIPQAEPIKVEAKKETPITEEQRKEEQA